MLQERHLFFPLLLLWSAFEQRHAAVFKPIPAFTQSELDVKKFDKDYLSKMPVILKGTSVCPAKIKQVEDVATVCDTKTKVEANFRKPASKSRDNAAGETWSRLVGLSGDAIRTSLGDYIKRLATGKITEPTYLFGFDTAKNCPKALDSITWPSYFQGAFSGQWNCQPKSCINHAEPHMYINNGGFATNMHIDMQHMSFTSSMCQGRKEWRIITPKDMLKHKDAFHDYLSFAGFSGGAKGRESVVLSKLGNFESWSDDSPLSNMSVTVYEGVLEEGDTLYIPAGAPHAARGLSDTTVMVSVNDLTYHDMEAAAGVCKKHKNDMSDVQSGECDKNFGQTCGGGTHPFDQFSRSKAQYGENFFKRKDTSFFESMGCGDKVHLCDMMKMKHGDDAPAWKEYCKTTKGHTPDDDFDL